MSVPFATVRDIGERAEQVMTGRVAEFGLLGPWSLETSRRFWEGFTPAALAGEATRPGLRTVFCVEGDWHRAEAEVTQSGSTARVALDVHGRGWAEGGRADPVSRQAHARRRA